MKRVLIIYYSQSGQLTEIVNNISSTLNDEEIELDYYNIKLENEFPFPWNKSAFFDVFPESFLQKGTKLKSIPNNIINNKYDLIILGYQVWYLTPSIPITSLLKSKEGINLFKNTPVVTVIGCRNMWIMAQEKLKKLLINCDAKLVGNIALVDRHINHISVITVVQWMFTGKKNKYLGIFPKPGVSQKDIDESAKFGNVILNSVLNNNFAHLQNNLLKVNAVKINPFLVLVDKRANVLFEKWAKLIASKGESGSHNRKFWLKLFNYYLLFAIWVISPIVFILFLITYLPFMNKIDKDKKYYSSTDFK